MITCILFIGCSKQQILSGNSKESINLQNEEFTVVSEGISNAVATSR